MEKLICTGSVGEIYMAQPKVAAQYLKNNKPKTLKMAINQLRSGEDCWCYDLNQIIEGHLKLRKELSEQLKLKNELLEFFEFFIENSKFIEDTHYWVPLSEIFFYKVFWVRDYQS